MAMGILFQKLDTVYIRGNNNTRHVTFIEPTDTKQAFFDLI